jgi:L-lactate dehydrogenase complex protein LldG
MVRQASAAEVSARERILEAIRRNQPAARGLPLVPRFADAQPPLRPWFEASLARMAGRLLDPPRGTDLAALVRERWPEAKIVCSATAEIPGNRQLSPDTEPKSLADVDLAIVRAAFGVAETGSVFLDERDLVVNALGYLAQHLAILLDPARIIGNLHEAYARPEFQAARYAVLMTGPSATADIEGVLIHGAQGVRSLTVILAPPTA